MCEAGVDEKMWGLPCELRVGGVGEVTRKLMKITEWDEG